MATDILQGESNIIIFADIHLVYQKAEINQFFIQLFPHTLCVSADDELIKRGNSNSEKVPSLHQTLSPGPYGGGRQPLPMEGQVFLPREAQTLLPMEISNTPFHRGGQCVSKGGVVTFPIEAACISGGWPPLQREDKVLHSLHGNNFTP